MTIWASSEKQHDRVEWGGISLPQPMVEALGVFLAAPRRAKGGTEWHARCMAVPKAAAFFNGQRDYDFARITASKIVADAYEELRDQKAIAVIQPSLVLKLRQQATSMCACLPAAQHLPGDAGTKEFRSGLNSLCQWTTPVSAPTNKSGDICARAFTLSLAFKFAGAFMEIPVEYIHSLVLMGWPNRSLSATWKLLSGAMTDRIKREAEALGKQAAKAHSTTVLAIQAAAHSRHVMSESQSLEVEQLQDESERLRQGKPRFANDAGRLRAMQDIARTLDDSALANELFFLLRDELKDFSHDPH